MQTKKVKHWLFQMKAYFETQTIILKQFGFTFGLVDVFCIRIQLSRRVVYSLFQFYFVIIGHNDDFSLAKSAWCNYKLSYFPNLAFVLHFCGFLNFTISSITLVIGSKFYYDID